MLENVEAAGPGVKVWTCIGVATLFRFWSYRTWVFKALPARETVADAEAILEQAADTGKPRQQVR